MMFKTLRGYALVAALALPLSWIPIVAHAEHQALIFTSMTTVDDVSATLTIASRGTSVYWHINGVFDMVIDLQRESGSPGSGAWERIVSDIAPTANGLVRGSYASVGDSESVRLFLRTDTSGTAITTLFDGRQSPRVLARATHVNLFDEFVGEDVGLEADTLFSPQLVWLADTHTQGTGCDALVTIQEGAVDLTAGGGGTIAEDVAGCSLSIVNNDAGLVSDGVMQINYRWRFDSIAGANHFVGLSDTAVVANTIALFTVDSNVVADTASTNDIAIGYSSDATDTNSFQPASTNAGAVGNNADEFACTETVVVNTYYRTTIEIESTGDAMFFVDDVLCAVEPLAVATTARLVPYWWATSSTEVTPVSTVIIRLNRSI